ncbi:MAG: DJ-1/PfpI family protein [Candidatus Gracilibacteria bacterium]
MKILIVIAPEGYQDIEYETPKKVLQDAGYEIITTSTQEVAHGSLGGSTKVDLLLDQVNPSDYIAIVFVGGPGSHFYFDYQPALNLAKDFYNSGKLTTAICAGPSILANAGLLKGKTVTSFSGQAENLKANGATYTGNPVEQDGTIITANGPSSAQVFGEKIAKALKSLN